MNALNKSGSNQELQNYIREIHFHGMTRTALGPKGFEKFVNEMAPLSIMPNHNDIIAKISDFKNKYE